MAQKGEVDSCRVHILKVSILRSLALPASEAQAICGQVLISILPGDPRSLGTTENYDKKCI